MGNKNMDMLAESLPGMELAPVQANQRIEALDAIRGFALIGICLMNIEFFNRALGSQGFGMPQGLTGINWLASYFVAYFVAGKFWTIFSLLFGMGFAIMLTRAEAAGRGFIRPYVRRIAALAVFGALHTIFLFGGDILFSYAVAAAFLLVALYGTWKWILGTLLVLVGMSFIPGLGQGAGGAAGALAFTSLVALYLRNEKRVCSLSVISFMLIVLGAVGIIAAGVMIAMHAVPQVRGPVIAIGVLFVLLGLLANKFHNPVEARSWRAGAAIYLLTGVMMTIGGLVNYLTPPEPVVAAAATSAGAAPAAAVPAAAAAAPAVTASAAKADDKKVDDKKTAAKPALTDAQKKAERKAEREKQLKKNAEEVANEIKVNSTGSYADVVRLRASRFVEHAQTQPGFATLLIGMFLLGTWFIRSGVMADTGAHLPLFRKFAMIGLPLGIGIGLASSLIATGHVAGAQNDGYMFANGLLMIGNLAASLGYVGVVVLFLHNRSSLAKVRVLAPYGRMALTNYLCQSLVMSSIFFGYGFGLWGMGRTNQVLVALLLCAVQVALSQWWLARFRYGPAEWLWRAVTYMKIPAMRIDTGSRVLHVQPTN
jgi:uncharacterized membrane protein YeiB